MVDDNTSVAELVASMTAPLKERIAKLDGVIDERMKELDGLRSQRREAQRVLTRVTGVKPGPKNGAPSSKAVPWQKRKGREVTPEESDAALAFVQTLPNHEEGFTITNADLGWRAANHEPKMSSATWRDLIADWHKAGVVRVVRKGKGSSVYYKVVGK